MSHDNRRIAATAGALGNAWFLAHHADKALPLLNRSLSLARWQGFADIQAASANDLGNLWASLAKPVVAQEAPPSATPVRSAGLKRGGDMTWVTRALKRLGPTRDPPKESLALGNAANPDEAFYQEAIAAAQRAGHPDLEATATVNIARVYERREDNRGALGALQTTLHALEDMLPSATLGQTLVTVGRVAQDLPSNDTAFAKDRLDVIYTAFRRAAAEGRKRHDQRLLSQAYGYLGAEYLAEHRTEEASYLTDRAAFAAQAGNYPEGLFRWEWQRGKLLSASGDPDRALEAYRRAVAILQSIRQDVPVDYQNGRSSFRETMGPLFTSLADLLLKQSALSKTPNKVQSLLRETQQTIELLKAAELEDYFKDQCASNLQSKKVAIDKIAAKTAVLYPIIFPDRLEILVDVSGALTRATSPMEINELNKNVSWLRSNLEDPSTADYLIYSQKVYDALLKPVSEVLRKGNIETLVYVPDGFLRLVPLAVLNDGKQFVVEKFAVSTVPGLSLVDGQAMKRNDPQALVAGISVSVQDAPPLPGVDGELSNIERIVKDSTSMHNEAFQLDHFIDTAENKAFSVIHIASHGFFSGDPDQSFVLTYDGFLTMNRLEQVMKFEGAHSHTIDLLTLSACSTAQGDDRAALGLGGVAVKAGARSAMASLWPVFDEATAILIPEFYRQLLDPNNTKAESLRRAQLLLLHNPSFQHPAAWAPYLLIGNWL